jgi:imidazolonepropionase-like amidohydrolase
MIGCLAALALLMLTPPVEAAAIEAASNPLHDFDAAGRAVIEAAPEGQPLNLLITGATVYTASGEVLEEAHVHIADGVIKSVGAGAIEVADAIQIDGSGKFVTPGIIDTHSHLGVYPSPGAKAHGDGNEATQPVTAGVWAEHSFWPQDPGLYRALAGGVTAIQVLPGSANLVGGRGVVLQLVPSLGARAMRFPGAPETVKMACGENPKRVYGERGGPSTRMGNIHGQRQAFIEARDYLDKWAEYGEALAEWEDKSAEYADKPKKKYEPGKRPEAPERDLGKETLAGVLNGSVLAQIHCYRADDMLNMVQISDEFGFEIRSFHHALEAYKIRDVLAEKGIASSTWADWWGFKLEAYDGIPENAALLTEQGARAIIHSDSAIGIQRLNQEAAKAYHAGLRAGVSLTEDDAIRWITANPAWALGIEKVTGSLEVDKRADIVIWDGHPFSVYSAAEKVFVEGVLRYDKEAPGGTWSDFLLGQEVAQ